jgi:murein DD-endopeptidase MepM/ murein hydrolase activator NlpD
MIPRPISVEDTDNWVFIGLALIPAIIIALVVLGHQPIHQPEFLGTPTPTPTFTPTPTLTPTPTFTPTPTPTATPTATPVLSPTKGPTLTLAATPTVEPTPTIPTCDEPLKEGLGGEDHYWLEQPFGPEHNQHFSRFYPYASTGDGLYLLHHGVDTQNETGTPVLAVADGKVVVAGDDSTEAYGRTTDFYGQLVIIELNRTYLEQPVFCLYGHLSEVSVAVGQEVKVGDVLGQVGMTGIALGPHLHFEVRVGSNAYRHTRNPELWLKPFPDQGTIAGRLLYPNGCPILDRTITIHQADAPDERWASLRTYIFGEGINPDDNWGENFCLGDVPAGAYVLRTVVNRKLYTYPVEVVAGQTAFVEIEIVW